MRPQDIPNTHKPSKWDRTDAERVERDAEIIRLYNREGSEHVSMSDLARRYGLSLSRVSTIINKAEGRYWAVRPKQKCPSLP